MMNALCAGGAPSCGLRMPELVLDEELRADELADVVVVGADAGEQRVGPDLASAGVGERARHDRVVVRARSPVHQLAQQRCSRIAQLEEADVVPEARQAPHQRQEEECADQRQQSPAHPEDGATHGGGVQPAEGHRDQHDQAEDERGRREGCGGEQQRRRTRRGDRPPWP